VDPHGEELLFLKASAPSYGTEIDEDTHAVKAAEFIKGAVPVVVAVHHNAHKTSLTQDPHTQKDPEPKDEEKAQKTSHPLMITLFKERIPGSGALL